MKKELQTAHAPGNSQISPPWAISAARDQTKALFLQQGRSKLEEVRAAMEVLKIPMPRNVQHVGVVDRKLNQRLMAAARAPLAVASDATHLRRTGKPAVLLVFKRPWAYR